MQVFKLLAVVALTGTAVNTVLCAADDSTSELVSDDTLDVILGVSNTTGSAVGGAVNQIGSSSSSSSDASSNAAVWGIASTAIVVAAAALV